MQYCPFCGQANPLAAMTCGHCGALQPESSGVSGGARPAKSQISTSLAVPSAQTSGSIPMRRIGDSRTSAPVRAQRLSAQTRYLDLQNVEEELRDTPDNDLRGRLKLVVEQGLIIGEQYLLSEDLISIGRHDVGSDYCPDIELSAQDPSYVHRQHAELSFTSAGQELKIKDLGGRNGVFVNNRSLGKFGESSLHAGDRIRIGRVVLKLRLS